MECSGLTELSDSSRGFKSGVEPPHSKAALPRQVGERISRVADSATVSRRYQEGRSRENEDDKMDDGRGNGGGSCIHVWRTGGGTGSDECAGIDERDTLGFRLVRAVP